MTCTYQIHGSEQPAASLPQPSPDVEITRGRRLLPGSARAAGVGEITAAGDEVVRVELENGFVLGARGEPGTTTGCMCRRRGCDASARAPYQFDRSRSSAIQTTQNL